MNDADDWDLLEPDASMPWLLTIALAVVAGVIVLLAPLWLSATTGFVWSHWEWFVLPLAGLALGLVLLEWGEWITVAAVLSGLAAAAHLDGVIDIGRIGNSQLLEMPAWLWILSLLVGGFVAATLSTWDADNLGGHFWMLVTAALVVALGYIAVRALGSWIGGTEIRTLGSLAEQHWPPVALAVAIVLLGLRARAAFWADLYQVEDPDEDMVWRAARGRAPRDEPASHASQRGILRLVALARRVGLDGLDLLLVAVTAILFAAVALYYLPDVIVSARNLTQAEAATAAAEERRTVLAILAALGAALTLVYTHLRHQLDRDSNTSSRFNEGVSQLATASLSTRLGGIYSLGQVARQSPQDADNVVEVLATFARESTSERSLNAGASPVSPVTTTCLSVLSKTPEGARPPELRGLDLSGESLDDLAFRPATDLSDADLHQCTITRGRFSGTRLRRASFQGSSSKDTSFRHADLAFAVALEASFNRCDLNSADFEKTNFARARFERTSFEHAQFTGCDCREAVFDHCDLSEASMNGVDLSGADLSSSHLDAQFMFDIKYDEHTRWPVGFDAGEIARR